MQKMIWVLLLLLSGNIEAQVQIPSSKKLTEKLDSIALQDVPPRAPGIATFVLRHGALIYKKVKGYADFSDSSQLTDKTRFNLASNGKQFTALAISLLVEEGKLQLEEEVRKFLPGIYPQVSEKITIRSLLTHTSGIRDCYDLWQLQGLTWWEQRFNNQDVLSLVKKQETLNFSPGARFLYSNTNYILLAMIVEVVSRQDFVEFTNKLFKTLNMPNTSFENKHLKIRGDIASPYFNFGQWTTYPWIWEVCGDGNLFSTLEDQLVWEAHLQGKMDRVGNKKIGTIPKSLKRAVQKMKQPLYGNQEWGYGYGIEFGTFQKIPYHFHEGATGAWKTTVIRIPSQQISIFTCTNSGKVIPASQTRQMATVLLNEEKPISVSLKESSETRQPKIGPLVTENELEGVYMGSGNFYFHFEKTDSILYLKRFGRNDVEIVREAPNVFHQKFDPLFKQEFTKDSLGNLFVTVYHTSHDPYTLKKEDKDTLSGFSEHWHGLFFNAELGILFEVQHQKGRNFMVRNLMADSTLFASLNSFQQVEAKAIMLATMKP